MGKRKQKPVISDIQKIPQRVWWNPLTAVNERAPPDGKLNILKRFALLPLKEKITAIYRFWAGRLDRPQVKKDALGRNKNVYDESHYYVRWYQYWGGEDDNYQNYLGIYDYVTLGIFRALEAFFRGHWSRRDGVHTVSSTPVGIVFHGLLNMIRAAFGVVLTIPTVIIGSVVYAILKVTVLQGIALVKADVQGAAEEQGQTEEPEINHAPYQEYLERIHRADAEAAPTSKVGQLFDRATKAVKNIRKPKVEPITHGVFISKSRDEQDKFDDPEVYDYGSQTSPLIAIKSEYDPDLERTQYFYQTKQLANCLLTKVVIEGDWSERILTKEHFDLPQPLLDHLNRIKGKSDAQDYSLTCVKTTRGVERTVFNLYSKRERKNMREHQTMTRFLLLADPLYQKPDPLAPTQPAETPAPVAEPKKAEAQPKEKPKEKPKEEQTRFERFKGFLGFKTRQKTTGEKIKEGALNAKKAVTPKPSVKGKVVGGVARLIL